MKKILICLTLILSTSTFAKNQNDFSEYSDSTPLDRSIYHDRSDSREVKKYNPSAICSDFKKSLVAEAFNVDLFSVACTTAGGPVQRRINNLELTGVFKVLKVVKNNEIFFYIKN